MTIKEFIHKVTKEYNRYTRRKSHPWIRKYFPMIVLIAITVLTVFVFSAFFTYFYFAHDLKSTDSIMNNHNTGLILTDRNGKPFFTFYAAHSTKYVPLSKIPLTVQHAVISAEDQNFYHHPGFSISGIFRSMIADLQHRDAVQGGSTITQQLVKNAILTPRKDFLRKFQEIIVAQEIERKYSKDQILEMYLNSVYFGDGAFGINEAAYRFFGEKPQDLTLAQASMLAGLLPAPSHYSPLSGSNTLAKQRQKYVLDNMVHDKYITAHQEKQAYVAKLTYANNQNDLNTIAPHFALMVRDELIKKYGEEKIIRSGFKVRTSIDLSLQKFAEQDVADNVKKLAGDNVSNGAAVVMDPKNGEILAMVGSVDWNNPKFGKVNVATSPRQPGSSFKPIVYSLAMLDGDITPATVLSDTPTTFPGDYKPLDYDKRFRGPVTVRRALSNSLNIPAVEVMEKVGVPSVLNWAQQLGITTLGDDASQYGLSLVLGAGEVKLIDLTGVYATFADNGIHNDPTSVLSIQNKEGQTIYTYQPKNEEVMGPQVPFLISSILSDNNARAEEFGNTLTISRTAAVKTGTTENYRDAWTMGYTPQVVVGVWVGNNDGESMDTVAGSLGAAPIWKDLMEHYLVDKPVLAFTPPNGVVEVSICGLGFAGSASASAHSEYFLTGTQPAQSCIIPHTIAGPNASITPGPVEDGESAFNSSQAQQQIQQQIDHQRALNAQRINDIKQKIRQFQQQYGKHSEY